MFKSTRNVSEHDFDRFAEHLMDTVYPKRGNIRPVLCGITVFKKNEKIEFEKWKGVLKKQFVAMKCVSETHHDVVFVAIWVTGNHESLRNSHLTCL